MAPAFVATAPLPLRPRGLPAARTAAAAAGPTMALSRRALLHSASLAALAAALPAGAATRGGRFPSTRAASSAPAAAAVATPVVAKPVVTKPVVDTAAAADAARAAVRDVIGKDPTLAGTLLRLAFHDSFTFDVATGAGGANGSIRLETGRGENSGLTRAVDALGPVQEATGLGWGDLVAVAGAEVVEATGGPHIEVALGRSVAEAQDPRGALPPPNETVEELRARFEPRGFNDRDIVALSGAHTLGRAGGGGVFTKDSNGFSNDYFVNLMWFEERRLEGESEAVGPPDRPNFQLPSDLGLLDDASTLAIVKEFAEDQGKFFSQFAASYNKMVNVGTPMASRA